MMLTRGLAGSRGGAALADDFAQQPAPQQPRGRQAADAAADAEARGSRRWKKPASSPSSTARA